MPLLVEMGWGGLIQAPSAITWTDITQRTDVAGQRVTITRGASDELSDTQPGTATLRLDNQDGALTPGNSASPFYPFVRRNAPIRISVAVIPQRTGSAPYPLGMLGDDFDDNRIDTTLWPNNYGGATETGGRARIPLIPGTTAAYQSARQWTLAGTQLTGKLVTVPAAGGSSAAVSSMWVNSTTSGTRVGWRYNAITGVISAETQVGFFDGTAVGFTYSASDHAWLRVREQGGTLYWESSGDGFGWTLRRTLATPAWVTSQTVAVELTGQRTGGVADYVEWDLLGATIRPRFWGVVNEWPVQWDGLYSTVTLSCTDLFKRLGRLPALRSCLAEEILTQDAPGVYDLLSACFPLAEDAGATAAGDISGRGCPALTLTQAASGGTLEFGAEGLAATGETALALTPASATAGKYLAADLGPGFQSDNEVTADHSLLHPMVSVWFKTTTNGRVICGLFESNLDHQLVFALNASGVLTVEHAEVGSPLTVTTTASGNLANGAWHHLLYDGSAKTVWVDGVQAGGTLAVVSMISLRNLHVGGYRGTRLWSGQIAYVTITHANGPAAAYLAPLHNTAGTTAFAGESADLRIKRLARYAGIPSVTVWGTTHDPVAGQGTGGTGALARMREIETTESGRLFAERDWYGLAYQSRDIRYNPSPVSEVFTIDYADLDTGSVQLADDDQKLCNAIDATRPGGATQRVTDAASITANGPYEKTLDILKTNDNSVLDAAHWLVSRYADPQPELREVPVEAATLGYYLDILDADIGSYFSVYNMPPQASASSMRVTVEGYEERISDTEHWIQFRTSASATDSVWVLDDAVYGVLGTTTRLAY
ncbi:hypothetical protein ACIQNU_03315 [Streptomyces sp. NPDC091292]|uniref:hypothetical protein n=1 Tax=Streptomyces sp. NPDC091292 TaxID=3365991 RepID=UPI003806681F